MLINHGGAALNMLKERQIIFLEVEEQSFSFSKNFENKRMNKLYIFYILFVFLLSGCNDSSTNEEQKMENKNISSLLKEIKLTDNKKMDSLSKDISEESRKDAVELVKILHSDKEEESQKAAMVLMSIGDLAFNPLLESLDTKNEDNFVWETDVLVSVILNNRNKMTSVLNSMLLDKRKLNDPEPQALMEEQPVPRRVCDEGYLMLRRLTAFKETEEELMINEKLFLNMTDDQKDKEIERIKSSKEWISLIEHLSDEGID